VITSSIREKKEVGPIKAGILDHSKVLMYKIITNK